MFLKEFSMNKPFSEAANRNKEPILDVLKQYLKSGTLLEIGSGTGQHSVFFAKNFPNISWITSDQPICHDGIKAWLTEANLTNVLGPIKLVVGEDDFPTMDLDYVYSANTLHIMSWDECKILFKLLGKNLKNGTYVFFYGPFNYGGYFTSESNKAFDEMIKQRDSKSGLRNFEDIKNELKKEGFAFIKDHQMPANNHVIVFKK
jgi:cyclopropane fatty-acyl-phospholipid synthase-like methyltransferase